MNHWKARQRESDGRWDYTSHNDRSGTHAVGYCHAYRPYDETDTYLPQAMRDALNEKEQEFIHKYHTDGHATAEEACQCRKQYDLDHHLHLCPEVDDPDTLHRCLVCREFCSGHAIVGHHDVYQLCPAHCTRAEVEKLYRVGEHWGS